MRVGVVVSTLGMSNAIGLLFESLADQSHPAHQIVVVDQGDGTMVAEQVALWQDRLPIRRLTSDRGVSLGRNIGWKALDECDVVAFPDDDCTYGSRAFADVVREFEADPSILALSGRLTGSGDRLAFGEERVVINRRNVWTTAIEATTFYRQHALRDLGGFDENLGIGAATLWQSGEGTDLLIRAMETGGRAVYAPAIVITEHQRETTTADYRRKVRLYGRGTGRVYRTHYSTSECILVLVKPIVAALLHALKGRPGEAMNKAQAALGRAEGMISPAPKAINRSR